MTTCTEMGRRSRVSHRKTDPNSARSPCCASESGWKGADEVQVLAVTLCKRYRLETFIPDFPLLLSWMLLRLFCKAGLGTELVEDGALL